jgi:hypothetical protein
MTSFIESEGSLGHQGIVKETALPPDHVYSFGLPVETSPETKIPFIILVK